VCLRKEYGGLGVRKLREFNTALLEKWRWRLLIDREGLWKRVLVARYGVEDGSLEDGGPELFFLVEGESENSRWGGGGERWLSDCWCGDVPLCERFSRLYVLADNKAITVRNMFFLGWEAGGDAWKWRRWLWVWVEELVAGCRELLSNVTLQDTTTDSWQ